MTVFSIGVTPLTPARAVRLYEQEQGEPFGSPLLGLYVRRWASWWYVSMVLRALDVFRSTMWYSRRLKDLYREAF
jgi:hypothetical protein